MRLIYIANIRLPTEKGHGWQIMKMCESFARQGIEVELIIPWRFNQIKENPFGYYGVENNFKITKLPSFDLVRFGKVGFIIQSLSFAKCAFWYALFRKANVVYSRDELPLFFLSFLKKNIFWENHDGKFNFVVKRVLTKCKGIVSISGGLKDFYKAKGIDADKILVAPDGVDLKEFDIPISKEDARRRLGLPLDKKIILYTGSFYLFDWKGIDILLEASKFFSDAHLFLFVGGSKEDIKKIQNKYKLKNTMLIVHELHKEIPYYLKAADVLVLPNKKGDETSEKYTSPLKLFEYMATERPIVASNLPSIREILNEKNAILVKPDSPKFLTAGIIKALENPDFSDRISKQAYSDVREYTWSKRSVKIIEFIKSGTNKKTNKI